MMDKSKNLLLYLLQVLLFVMLSAMPSYIHAATGTVTITNPSPITVQANSTFNVQGTYILSSDDTPTGAVDPASGLCVVWGNPVPGTYSPTYHPSFKWYWIYAYVRYEIDGVLVRDIARIQRDAWGNTSFGSLGSYNLSIDTTGMALGDHTLKVYLQDQYSVRCFRSSEAGVAGDIVAAQTFNFTILGATPPTINIALDKQSYVPCEGQQATINVTSNDPTPNGGTVTLTLPNGNTATASFAGKTAALTLADFGLPTAYLGTFQAGDLSKWNASVTTSAGKTASTTASANIIAGGLNVTITPAKSIIEPTLPVRRKKGQNGANQTTVNISVKDTSLQPIDTANVTLTVERASTKFGGHDHDATTIAASNRPLGTVTSATGKGRGVYTATYTASEFAAEDKVRAKVNYLGCSADVVSPSITSQVFPLSFLTVPPPHVAIGGTIAHHGPNNKGNPTSPDNNHWVTLKTNSTMSYLMDLYSINYGAGLQVNDASLPFGGRFDVNGNWAGSHSLHRRGIDVDIRLYDTANTAANETVEANLKALEILYPELEPLIFYETHGSGSNRHSHIYFW